MVKRWIPVLLVTLMVAGYGMARAQDAPMMTVEQLSSFLGKPDLVILDVRTPYDWKTSDVKIKGAVREDPMKFGAWIAKYPKEKTLVLYCA